MKKLKMQLYVGATVISTLDHIDVTRVQSVAITIAKDK